MTRDAVRLRSRAGDLSILLRLAGPVIMARLGIMGRERVHYWRLIAWTLVRRPRLLPQAVTLAIYGYHFRLVAERVTQRG